jgi:hypothetical protein
MWGASENNPEPGADDRPWLELPLARLRVAGDELVRLNGRGNPVLRLPLRAIDQVSTGIGFDPMSALFLVAALGAAALGRFVSENNTLTVLLYLAAFGGVLLAIFGSVRQRVVLVTAGKPLAVNCPDAADEVAGFAASLSAELASRKGERGERPV